MKLYNFHTDDLKPSKKIVAFYDDGSGANLFKIDKDSNYIDVEGTVLSQTWFTDCGYMYYAYLPNDFKLWSDHFPHLDGFNKPIA